MNREETCAYLAERGVEYEIMEHPAVYTMAEVEDIQLPYPEADAKSLFLRDDRKRNYYMITVQGEKRVDLKAFRRRHGLRSLSFAPADELMSVLGLIPGAVTPLGLLNDEACRTELYLDVAFTDRIGVHPNENTATLWMRTADLIRVISEHGNRVHVVEI